MKGIKIMSRDKVIELDSFGIMIILRENGEGEIYSDLKDEATNEATEDNAIYNNMMDALDSIILAHAMAGIDVNSPAYLEGIEAAVEACANNC